MQVLILWYCFKYPRAYCQTNNIQIIGGYSLEKMSQSCQKEPFETNKSEMKNNEILIINKQKINQKTQQLKQQNMNVIYQLITIQK